MRIGEFIMRVRDPRRLHTQYNNANGRQRPGDGRVEPELGNKLDGVEISKEVTSTGTVRRALHQPTMDIDNPCSILEHPGQWLSACPRTICRGCYVQQRYVQHTVTRESGRVGRWESEREWDCVGLLSGTNLGVASRK